MRTIRVIPCLDVDAGRVVKGINFSDLQNVGDPVVCAKNYLAQGADELVLLDISATNQQRATCLRTISKVREVLNVPLTVGGGVRSVEDARELLNAGADKVSVNSAAVMRPKLIIELCEEFGSQCVVVAIDAVRSGTNSWEVVVHSGEDDTGIDVLDWAGLAEELGAGEILLTSWDRDGTREGYELELIKAVRERVMLPIIASGGASSVLHLKEAISAGADAVLAASIFHYSDLTVTKIKQDLTNNGVSVRR